MSSSAHIDNKKKNVLVLGKGPTQGLEHTLSAEKIYSINFTLIKKKVYIIMEQIVIFLSMVKKFTNLKQKDSEIVASLLCLGNISKDWSIDHMKKTRFNGYVYGFSVDYDSTDVDDIKDIHKYLMKKNDIAPV